MTTIELLVVILLGLVLLPALLQLLQQIFPLIRARLAVALPAIAGLARRGLQKAGSLLTDEGKLPASSTVAQVAGSTVMIAAGVVFALCDLQLTLATLGPIFNVEAVGAVFGGFDRLLGLSVVLLAVVYGLGVTDLLGWTFITHFAVIERARVAAFCMALGCFIASLAVTVALAAYRLPALIMDETVMSAEEAAVWLQGLPAVILITLAVLLFLGIAFTFMSLETFFSAIVALCMVVGCLVMAVTYFLLAVVDLVIEVALVAVTSLLGAIEPITNTLHAGVRGVSAGVAQGGRNAWTKLSNLTRPAVKRAAVPTVANGVNGDVLMTTTPPQVEEPAQRPNPNGLDARA